jgi:hypothetical protein
MANYSAKRRQQKGDKPRKKVRLLAKLLHCRGILSDGAGAIAATPD